MPTFWSSAQAKTRIAETIFRIPIPLSFWGQLEKLAAIAQGKGWGMSSIQQEVNVCMSLLEMPPRIICDVGANHGEYAWEWLQRVPNCRVHMFEPARTNLAFLQKRFSGFNNVNILPVALSNQRGSATLYASTPGSGEASLSPNPDEAEINSNRHEERIELQRLDAYADEITLNDSTPIDLIKIDVEGHELAVLEGCGELISRTRLVQFEYGARNLDTRTSFRDFWAFFQDHSFHLYRITPRGAQAIPSYSVWEESQVTTNFVAVTQRHSV